MGKPLDITGKVYGKLTAIRPTTDKHGCRAWECKCECGNIVVYKTGDLTRRDSCGCWGKQRRIRSLTKHGLANTPTWVCWYSMIQRCYHANHVNYALYGGSGISVDDRYRDSHTGILNLIADIGERPSKQHSLDRIDNTKGYIPGNIRWSTWKVQNRNKKRNHFLIYKGESHCLSEWAEIVGLGSTTISERLRRGWSVEDALNKELQPSPYNKGVA